jgi:hypothetical protein
MLVELCARNYETSNGLVNGSDRIVENFTKRISKYLIWIHFHNLQIRHNTQIHNLQIYKKFQNLTKKWMPIECNIVKIQIGSNPFHTIIRIQF